ncbi:MAG: hypothetical protein IJB62_07705 [Alistipes sp.]|nr:hypothetical protein [Alistipes sp.]
MFLFVCIFVPVLGVAAFLLRQRFLTEQTLYQTRFCAKRGAKIAMPPFFTDTWLTFWQKNDTNQQNNAHNIRMVGHPFGCHAVVSAPFINQFSIFIFNS